MRQPFAHRLAVLGLLLPLLLLPLACGQQDVYEPLPDAPNGPNAIVAGSVRTPDGRGLADAVVVLESLTAGRTVTVLGKLAPQSSGFLRATTTDPAGRFAFSQVPGGRYLLSGDSRNHQRGVQELLVAQPAALETTFVDIELTPTGDFYGRVLLENGTNHQSTVVYVEGTSYVAVTDDGGGYVLVGVPVGTWTVTGTHGGYLDRSTSGAIAAAGDSVGLTPLTLPLDSNIRPVVTASGGGNVCDGGSVSLAASASDADGSIVRYEWDFEGDGTWDYTSPSTATTTHLYSVPGSYLAKVRVTDDAGAIGLSVVGVTALPNPAVFYVSAATGSDANPGTALQPFATIARGITEAAGAACSGKVIVATGTYPESPVFATNVTVAGGYTEATWTRTPGDYSVVQGGVMASQATSITEATVSGLDIRSAGNPAPGGNSIALRVMNCGSTVQFIDCRFTAGIGGPGNPGANGTAGNTGSPGSTGANGSSGGNGGNGGFGPGLQGGSGGMGGYDSNGSNGNSGTGGAPGGSGGFRSSCGGSGGPGGSGSSAGSGSSGPGGSGASPVGINSGGLWTPNNGGAGNAGQPGFGGGGGGGGGGGAAGMFCTADRAGGGGGGGAGGSGGQGGTGGSGGGASFAAYVWGGSPIFTACTFKTSAGGAGGIGGAGASGGFGGNGGGGGGPNADGGPGGQGGFGGNGGAGGGGQGGPGGPSWGVYRANGASPALTSSSYIIGPTGLGGSGGPSPASMGSNGPNGTSGNVF